MNLIQTSVMSSGGHGDSPRQNIGMFNQQFQAQRAQTEYSMFVQNPLVMQDMSRLWHLSAEVLRSGGRSLAEIEEFLGPVAALPTGDPKTPDEAMKEVVEGTHGEGGFPAIHPSDDNAKFVESITELLESPVFIAMGRPNEQGLLNYMQAQQQAHMAKMQQQMILEKQERKIKEVWQKTLWKVVKVHLKKLLVHLEKY